MAGGAMCISPNTSEVSSTLAAAGITLVGIVVLSLWCEWSRVRTLARIGKSRQQGPRSSRGRNLS